MKTLNSVILTLSLLLSTSIFAEASQVPKENRTVNNAISKYIECATQGKTSDIAELLDDSFKLCVSYNGTNKSYSKKQWVDYMKQTKSILRNCSTSYSLVENNSNFSIAKVEMEYPTFTKIDYVTMSSKHGDWTITNVFSTYK